jgi:dTDP-4-dehydrorhamnose 3,5-epimerase-like enzyme
MYLRNRKMIHTTVNDCKIIDIRKYADTRGYLSVIEGGIDIPFEIKRIYYLYMVPEAARGAHAHKELQQLMVATSGSVSVTLDDGKDKKTFVLDKPWKGLLVVPGLWRDLDNFAGGTVCMVLASEKYESEDYIRDYNEFLKYKGL